MAVVEYSHPIEAVQAISMLHNQRLEDRTITVKMDRFEKEPDRDRHGLPNGLKNIGMGLGANGAPLSDISSVIGQIQQQPAVNAFQSNGLGGGAGLSALIQQQPAAMQPAQSSYPAFQSQAVQQQLSAVLDQQPQYGQPPTAMPSYQAQAPSIRQTSPAPRNGSFYGQQPSLTDKPSYGATNQSPYGKQQQGYDDQRSAYGAPPVGASAPTRPSMGSYPGLQHEQPTSRVILIKNVWSFGVFGRGLISAHLVARRLYLERGCAASSSIR